MMQLPHDLAQLYAMLDDRPVVSGMIATLLAIMAMIALYGARHFVYTCNRLHGRQRHPYLGIECAQWPMVTVFIAAHNEENVVAGCLDALLRSTYSPERMRIVAVNDRSNDGTRDIIDRYAAAWPGRVTAFHRVSGKPGKPAALKEAQRYAEGDIALIFNADSMPGTGLVKELVAPFFDPEVGAVMGRVVPINTDCNLLTRMQELGHCGAYRVGQQARMNLKLMPQYAGTTGGVRRSALVCVGGWRDDMLAEDTDITVRMLLNGWKTVYTNRSECYEEVPQDWAMRVHPLRRQSKGHNQVLARYWLAFATSPMLTWRERIDGLLSMFVFMMPILLLTAWSLVVLLYFANGAALLSAFVPVLALTAFGTLGNFAAFHEIAVGVLFDGNRRRLRLLPFNLPVFFINLFAIAGATVGLVVDRLLQRELAWDKAMRYRQAPAK